MAFGFKLGLGLSQRGGGIKSSIPTSGLVFDLDASTLALSNGANVTTWADSGPNGLDAVETTNPPTYKINDADDWHNAPSVHFNAASERIVIPSDPAIGSSSWTYVVVYAHKDMEYDNTDGKRRFIINKSATNPAALAFGFGDVFDTAGIFYRTAAAPSSFETVAEGGWMMPDPLPHVAIFSAEDGSQLIDIDGDEWVGLTFGAPDAVAGSVAIGNHPTADGAVSDFDIYRVFAYNRVLNSAEKASIVDYVKASFFAEPFEKGEVVSALPATDNLFAGNTFIDGSTAYFFYTQGIASGAVRYATAPTSDPHNWTDQGQLLSSTPGSRVVIKKYAGTWYCYEDHRTDGDVLVRTAATLSGLDAASSSVIVAGSNVVGTDNAWLRFPFVLTPDESHDGNWHLIVDARTDRAGGEAGPILHYDMTDGTTVTTASMSVILSPSGAANSYDRSSMVGGSIYWTGSTYRLAFAGYNQAINNIVERSAGADNYPHAILLAERADFSGVFTKVSDLPAVRGGKSPLAPDATRQVTPNWYVVGGVEIGLFYTGGRSLSSAGETNVLFSAKK